MKNKMIIALALAMGAANLSAQKGADDGSRFGHGTDSINCLKNLSIYTEYVKTNNFKDAYLPWKAAFTECPTAQVSTYTNGAKILRWFIQNEKDAAKQKAYVDELMNVYDQRIKHLDALNQLVKKASSEGSILGLKAHDYITLSANPDLDLAYGMLSKAIAAEKEGSDYYVLQDFIDISARKFKKEDTHREQFIQDYLTASGYADVAYKANANKKQMHQLLKVTKENIDAFFINSGAADCASLQNIYGPKVEQNKANVEYLKQVISVMKMLGCTDQDAYFNASLYSHQLSPTAESATGCAYMAIKKKDMDGAVKFFDEAINLESDNSKKAEYAFTAATVLASVKSFSKARQYALDAIRYNGNYGAPYILIAQLYASSPNWSDEPALNRCTYFLAIDKLQRAKSVDPSVTAEANKLIGSYSAHTPKPEDLFFLNLKKGDSVTIGGWIGESTTIR